MEFAFEPYQKVIVRSHIQYANPEEFVSTIFLTTPEGIQSRTALNWAHGILFRFFPFAPTDSMSKEYIEGRLLWDHVEFAPMPAYRGEIAVPGKPLIVVSVVDVTRHALLGPFAEWASRTLMAVRQ
jgi:hypothetical protein